MVASLKRQTFVPFAMVLAALVMALTTTGWAQSRSSDAVFAVPEVPVYAEAESAAAARQTAQAMGRRRAMDLVLRRLTAEEDWVYLPRLAAGEPAPAGQPMDRELGGEQPNSSLDVEIFGMSEEVDMRAKRAVQLDPQDLDEIESGFGIFDEKTSGTTYRARITYRFKPDSVRRLLEMANLPYSEAQARRALVLPVLETENGTYLWETKNPWARAWLARPLVNELTPLVLPVGDRQDVETITTEEALELTPGAFAALAARYNVPQVIIARGKLVEKDGEFELSVSFVDAFLDGRDRDESQDQNADSLDSARLYDDEDGFGADPVTPVGNAETRGEMLIDAFFRGANDDFPALAQRAVEATVAKYARGWKERTLVDHAAVRMMELTAWFGTLDEWADIRNALEATPLVRDMTVGAFNNANAVMRLTVIGEQSQFILAMRQSSLTVWQAANGSWNVADFDRATRLQAELQQVDYERAKEAADNSRALQANTPEYRRGGPPPELPDGLRGQMGNAEMSPNGTMTPGAPIALDAPVSLEPSVGPDGADDMPSDDGGER